MQIQEFYTGKAFDADSFFGAHPGAQGTHFAVWAPSARQILVVLSSPAGQPLGEYPMQKTYSGCWETDVPAAVPGQCYQYRVTGADGSVVDHCDPYGTAMTLRPDGRSIVQGPSGRSVMAVP